MAGCSPLRRGVDENVSVKGLAAVTLAVLVAIAAGLGILAAIGRTASMGAENRFASEVLDSAPIPPEARQSSALSSPLLRQPFLVPAIPGLVSAHRLYVVGESSTAVERYILSHLARGAHVDTTGTEGGPTRYALGLVLAEPTTGRSEYFAQLVYTIVPEGALGSAFRVEAQTLWLAGRSGPTIPPGALATLTGYSTVSLALGSRGPVVVHLEAGLSARLARAVEALPPAPPMSCHEDAILYDIVFRTPHAANYEVEGHGCGGTVVLTVKGGRPSLRYNASCALIHLVRSLLPARARGTRFGAVACGAG